MFQMQVVHIMALVAIVWWSKSLSSKAEATRKQGGQAEEGHKFWSPCQQHRFYSEPNRTPLIFQYMAIVHSYTCRWGDFRRGLRKPHPQLRCSFPESSLDYERFKEIHPIKLNSRVHSDFHQTHTTASHSGRGEKFLSNYTSHDLACSPWTHPITLNHEMFISLEQVKFGDNSERFEVSLITCAYSIIQNIVENCKGPFKDFCCVNATWSWKSFEFGLFLSKTTILVLDRYLETSKYCY